MMLLWYERFSNLWPSCKRSLGSVLDRVSQREPFVVQKVKLRNPLLCKGRKWNKPGMIFASLAISLYIYVTWLLTFSWYYTDVSLSCLPSPVWFLRESLFYAACVHSSSGMFRHLESWGSTYSTLGSINWYRRTRLFGVPALGWRSSYQLQFPEDTTLITVLFSEA